MKNKKRKRRYPPYYQKIINQLLPCRLGASHLRRCLHLWPEIRRLIRRSALDAVPEQWLVPWRLWCNNRTVCSTLHKNINVSEVLKIHENRETSNTKLCYRTTRVRCKIFSKAKQKAVRLKELWIFLYDRESSIYLISMDLFWWKHRIYAHLNVDFFSYTFSYN